MPIRMTWEEGISDVVPRWGSADTATRANAGQVAAEGNPLRQFIRDNGLSPDSLLSSSSPRASQDLRSARTRSGRIHRPYCGGAITEVSASHEDDTRNQGNDQTVGTRSRDVGDPPGRTEHLYWATGRCSPSRPS